MSKLLREPLVHFVLLGAAFFLIYAWVGGRPGGEGEHIVITQGRVEQLAMGFSRMHQRAPDAAELDEMIDDAIREEIYYREAKALALDEDDTIIRRRLRQKLEFVSEDVAPVPEPDDAQLQAYLSQHAGQFRVPRAYSFSHVYFNPQRHDATLGVQTARLLSQLQSQHKTEVEGQGDAFLLGNRMDNISADELSRLFGADFEARLRTSPVGTWQGPVSSTYGVHLVLLKQRLDDRAASLASVRGAVRDQWMRAQREQANEKFYADLRKRYAVTVERAQAHDGVSAQVASKQP